MEATRRALNAIPGVCACPVQWTETQQYTTVIVNGEIRGCVFISRLYGERHSLRMTLVANKIRACRGVDLAHQPGQSILPGHASGSYIVSELCRLDAHPAVRAIAAGVSRTAA